MELVAVYTSISINEVGFVKSLLEGNGINATILDDTVASIAPHHVFGQGGSRLAVMENDVQAAREIIADYENNKNSSDH